MMSGNFAGVKKKPTVKVGIHCKSVYYLFWSRVPTRNKTDSEMRMLV
jgi:hypothetical protein